MDPTQNNPIPTTPPPLEATPLPANAKESKKSMYLIGGIILALLTCLFLSFLLVSRLISF